VVATAHWHGHAEQLKKPSSSRGEILALERVAKAVVHKKTRVIDVDLKSYFDTVRHDLLLKKVAERIDDDQVMHLLKLMLKASGKRGVPPGGVISPLLSNIYLNEVDKMLVRAKGVTRQARYMHIEYARFVDDRAPRRIPAMGLDSKGGLQTAS